MYELSKGYDFNNIKVKVRLAKYNNGNIAVLLAGDGLGYGSNEVSLSVANANRLEYGVFCANICDVPKVEDFLVRNKIASLTGETIKIGLWEYPVFKLNDEIFNKYRGR